MQNAHRRYSISHSLNSTPLVSPPHSWVMSSEQIEAMQNSGKLLMKLSQLSEEVEALSELETAEPTMTEVMQAIKALSAKLESITANTPSATKNTLTAKPSDGPAGGCWVWWKGKRHKVPTGVVYALIEYMWDRDYATYAELEEKVFTCGFPATQTVRARSSEVNLELMKIGIPWKLKPNATALTLTKQFR